MIPKTLILRLKSKQIAVWKKGSEHFSKNWKKNKLRRHLLIFYTIQRLGEKNNVADLVKETEETLKKFGRVKEYEKIKLNKIGSRIVRLIYFSYSDDFPLKWEIYCYSGKSGWQVLDLNVNTNFYDLFDRLDQ